MNLTYKLSGFRELDEALKQLPNKVARRAVTNGLRASGAVLVRGARSVAPVRVKGSRPRKGKGGGKPRPRGFLRRSIRQSKVFADSAGKLSVRIGVGPAFYGRFLEFGTRKMRPHPFFLRGVQTVAQAAFERLRVVIAAGIEKAAREGRR